MATKYEKTCPECGRVFISTRKSAIMCSNTCKNERQAQRNKQPVEDVCVECGHSFIKPYISKRRTCSKECLSKYKSKTIKESVNASAEELNREKKEKKSNIVKIEKDARKNGLHYADIQKQKTLAMVGSVKTELEPRKPRFIIYD